MTAPCPRKGVNPRLAAPRMMSRRLTISSLLGLARRKQCAKRIVRSQSKESKTSRQPRSQARKNRTTSVASWLNCQSFKSKNKIWSVFLWQPAALTLALSFDRSSRRKNSLRDMTRVRHQSSIGVVPAHFHLPLKAAPRQHARSGRWRVEQF